ncbi:MAG: DNA recombination protein RmuC [Faecalibacterium sp.]
MEIALVGLLILANILLIVILVRMFTTKQVDQTELLKAWIENRMEMQNAALDTKLAAVKNDLNMNSLNNSRTMSDNLQTSVRGMSETLQTSVHNMGTALGEAQTRQGAQLAERMKTLESSNEQRFENLRTSTNTGMETMRTTIHAGMESMRNDNNKNLDKIRHTVEEQLQDTLQKRISESFQSVTNQLEQVYKGLGEMQTLASDVGGLKQVLSGVKTRGILGEIQLGAILGEILAPEQYEVNFNTIPNSKNRVEFAIKLPGVDDNPIWLPIDSKFPGDTYAHLQSAQESGDSAALEAARKALIQVICAEAKDIREKYVEPPYTTNFGVLFLPFEGLYAEVVNLGLLERLQREYQINIAGPSTMAALLNSLQMGFKTLAIQKRSNEVWSVLGAVKSEFDKFGDALVKMQTKMRQTDEDFEKLIGTRTRAIQRKLRGVQVLDAADAVKVLELGTEDGFEAFAQDEE